jgi:hypothetical protein
MNTIEGSPRGTNIKTVKMNTRILLILLWVFYTVNFMYCDTLSSLEPGVLEMHMTGFTADGTVKITDGFLLGVAIMFEIPFLLIVLSWVLKYRANRWANIIAATLLVLSQISSLFLGIPSPAYIFYSTVEIAALLLIVWNAWKWTNPETLVPANEVARTSAGAGASIPHLMLGRK